MVLFKLGVELASLKSPGLPSGYTATGPKLGYSPGIRKWMGDDGTITVSLNMAETLVKFDTDLIQIKKPRNETKLNLKI